MGELGVLDQLLDTEQKIKQRFLWFPALVIGVEWNQATDTWTRIDINGNALTSFPYSFDELYPWSEIIRVTMSPEGLVNTFGEDGKGTGLMLDGSDGRVMVRIPKFYVKSEMPSANVYRWWISPVPRSGFELHPAFMQRGKGPGGADFAYVGAYEADIGYESHISTTKILHSRSGVQPYTGDADCIWELDFDGGQNEPNIGDELSTPTEGGFYLVDYCVTGGSWAGNDASGKLLIRKPGDNTCGWLDNEDITNDTQTNTLAGGAGLGVNGAPVGETAMIGTCRTYAGNIGTNWGQEGIWSHKAAQLLSLVEYAGADSQSLVGRGIVDKAGGTGFNGELTGADGIDANLATNGTGSGTGTNGLTPIAYRGIENLWGNVWQFIDGYNAVDGDVGGGADAKYRIINRDGSGTFADTLAGGDYEESTNLANPGDGYQKNIAWEDLLKFLLIPSQVGGSSSTYLYDYFYEHDAGETNILPAGGGWANGDWAGVASLHSDYVAATRGRSLGARLEFIG